MSNSDSRSIADVRKKFYETHELISTSYHEAGHLIYGLLHNLDIISVLVFVDKRSKRIEGELHYDPPALSEIKDPVLRNNRLHAEIGLSYAGLVAEKHYFKLISGSNKFPMFLKEGSSRDFLEAGKLFDKYKLSKPGIKRFKYKQKILKQIDIELQNNWNAITLIAHGLFKKKRFSLLELRKILTKKTKNKDFWKKKFKINDKLYGNFEPLDEKDIKSILSL
jgi:hypothetical protein